MIPTRVSYSGHILGYQSVCTSLWLPISQPLPECLMVIKNVLSGSIYQPFKYDYFLSKGFELDPVLPNLTISFLYSIATLSPLPLFADLRWRPEHYCILQYCNWHQDTTLTCHRHRQVNRFDVLIVSVLTAKLKGLVGVRLGLSGLLAEHLYSPLYSLVLTPVHCTKAC